MPDPENSSTNAPKGNLDPALIKQDEEEFQRRLRAILYGDATNDIVEKPASNLKDSDAAVPGPASPAPSVPGVFAGGSSGNSDNSAAELVNWVLLNVAVAERTAALVSEFEKAHARGDIVPPEAPPAVEKQTAGETAAPPAQATEELPLVAPNYRDRAATQPAAGYDPLSAPRTPEDFARVIAAQAQEFQNYGERLAASLGQGAFITNSVFTQLLNIIESQNQRLSQTEHKISDINSRIKSLKNP